MHPGSLSILCSLGTYKMCLLNKQLFFRFLATGDSYKTIAFNYQFGHATVARIVAETCETIWKTMKREYVPQPSEVDRVKNAGAKSISCSGAKAISCSGAKAISCSSA